MAGISGISIHLVDVSKRLLDSAVKRLEREGGVIAGRHHLSATELSTIDAQADLVLALGPFYRLLVTRITFFTSAADDDLSLCATPSNSQTTALL